VTAVVIHRGAWREGDPPGGRRFLDIGPLALELGGTLPAVRIAYETWGTLAPARDNAVLVLHALSGDSHVFGPAGTGHPTAGWWHGVVGPGCAIDTDRFFVVCANVIGGCQGTTGPSSAGPDGRPWGSRWPLTTIRDQVAAEVPLADALGVERWAAVVGGSMGGMRALEWTVMHPARVERVLVLAAAAEASADQVGLCRIQIDAVRADPLWHGGDYAARGVAPDAGLSIARRIAHLSYRTAGEVDDRFGRAPQDARDPLSGGMFAVESYLEHAADGLLARFDAGSYVALNLAMNSHEIGRGRGGTGAALAAVTARATVVGVDTDRLYPLHQQAALARALGAPLDVVSSGRGHDGFLVETEQVGAVLARALAS
jgi:homoserine O-acetyltransferase/O-succinyltransferase